MITRDTLKNYLSHIYHELYRNGASYDQAMPVVATILENIFNNKSDPLKNLKGYDQALNIAAKEFLREMYQESPDFKNLKPEDFLSVLKEIISVWEEQARPDKKRTKPDAVKIIQAVAKQLMPKGPFIDLAVGCGSLLENMPGYLKGQDIDKNLIGISETLLSIDRKINNTVSFEGPELVEHDSLELAYFDYLNGVYMFDPPLGDKRVHSLAHEFFGSIGREKINSEILFLANYLMYAFPRSYFIGLFPTTVLTLNSKIYNYLRSYLLYRSLIAVIKPYSGHILLVGQKEVNQAKYTEIPVIRIEKDLTNEQVDLIAKELTKGSDINLKSIKGYDSDFFADVKTRSELMKEGKDSGYSINLPVALQKDTEERKSPQELIKQLDIKETSIKNQFAALKTKITEYSPVEAEEKEEPVWFRDNKKIDKDNKELIKALQYFYSNIDTSLLPENFDSWQVLDFTATRAMYIFDHLKTLYKKGRLRFNKDNTEILFKENVESIPEPDWKTFIEYFQAENHDKNVKKALSYLDNTTKKVYKDFCEYRLLADNKSSDDTLLMTKSIKKKEIMLAFKVLKELGLIFRYIFTKKEDIDEDMRLYQEHMPYHPFIHGRDY